jgi:hypothetical protein
MTAYWILYNPLVYNLFNLIFGLILIVGIGLFIMNLVIIVISHHRSGPLIGIAFSLILIGVAADWQTIIPLITDIAGGITDYMLLYITQLINQYMGQNPLPAAIPLLSLLI